MPSMRMRAPELANARTVMLLGGAAFLVLPAAAFVGVMPADAWIRDALHDGEQRVPLRAVGGTVSPEG